MRPMLVGIVTFLISVTANELAKSHDAPPSYNQHYGEIADPTVWPISAVGVVTVALFSRITYCTGTLVAPKLVLTAAHCLFNGKLLVSSGNVRFVAIEQRGACGPRRCEASCCPTRIFARTSDARKCC